MNTIELLYVSNTISRKNKTIRQRLHFYIAVENITYDKVITILWTGEDGREHILAAHFHCTGNNNQEFWSAETQLCLTPSSWLAGNINFLIRLQTNTAAYWANNGRPYTSQADSGIQLTAGQKIYNLGYQARLPQQQKRLPITLALDKTLLINQVIIHWTLDNWRTSKQSKCYRKHTYWNTALQSNARNPNQYGIEIWKTLLSINDAFYVEYSIECVGTEQLIWDNNNNKNYLCQRTALSVMILNLHCYQEADQQRKLTTIAHAINEQHIDIVCLQEVAEYWNHGAGDWNSNTAKIINDQLRTPYHLHTDWSHLGFDQYREGVAILSRFPFLKTASQYVSASHDPFDIHARKVVMVHVHVPHIGLLALYSSHLSWWADGFQQQFTRLHHWATATTHAEKNYLLCGDFNIQAGSAAYHWVIDNFNYQDEYWLATSTVLSAEQKQQKRVSDDYRIDYIFAPQHNSVHAISANTLFTPHDYGTVSDHLGYVMTFVPKIINPQD